VQVSEVARHNAHSVHDIPDHSRSPQAAVAAAESAHIVAMMIIRTMA
jgi:hypothetical protein